MTEPKQSDGYLCITESVNPVEKKRWWTILTWDQTKRKWLGKEADENVIYWEDLRDIDETLEAVAGKERRRMQLEPLYGEAPIKQRNKGMSRGDLELMKLNNRW
jgi:hypothetical protein